jgi:hypothetical protein
MTGGPRPRPWREVEGAGGDGGALPHALDQVHGRAADEARDEGVLGAVVEVERRAGLGDVAVLHHHDAVGHGHGLDLVMGDVDGGGLEAQVQGPDLHPHLDAELGVEVGERLVEEEDLGVADDGAAHGDALALAARERAGVAVEIGLQAQDVGGAGHALGDLGLGHARHLEGEAHVRGDRLVGIERVVLEHHGDVALAGRQVVHHPVADADGAGRDPLEPRDHAQEGGLAAARGADEDDELPVGDIEAHAMDDLEAPVGLAQIADRDLGHPSPPFGADRSGGRPACPRG